MGSIVGDLYETLLREPASDPDGSARAALATLSPWLRSERAFVVLSHRDGATPSLDGWRITRHFQWGRIDRETLEIVQQFTRRFGSDPAEDPVMRARLRGQGRTRVALDRQLVSEDVWARSTARALQRETGIRDRVVASIPFGPRAEVHFGFDRAEGEPAFDADDLETFQAAEPALREVARRLALADGIGHEPLTPRQREVVRCLLRGLGEKEIADELDIAQRSAHHHVTSIYRKLRVRSRAELMARWVEPYPSDG